MAHPATVLVVAQGTARKEGRIADDQVVLVLGGKAKRLNAGLVAVQAIAKVAGGHVLGGLPGGGFVNLHGVDVGLRQALGQHHGNHPRTGADIERALRTVHLHPSPEQHPIAVDGHGTAVLGNAESFKTERLGGFGSPGHDAETVKDGWGWQRYTGKVGSLTSK